VDAAELKAVLDVCVKYLVLLIVAGAKYIYLREESNSAIDFLPTSSLDNFLPELISLSGLFFVILVYLTLSGAPLYAFALF